MTAQAWPGGPQQSQRTKQGGFSQHSLFSPETELKAHQTAGLLPRQLRASPSCSFLLEGQEGGARFTEDWTGLQICCLGPRLEERGVGVAMESGAEGWAWANPAASSNRTKLLPGNSLLRARGWSLDFHVRSERPHYWPENDEWLQGCLLNQRTELNQSLQSIFQAFRHSYCLTRLS